MFQLSSMNIPATLGFSAWHVKVFPLSSIDGTKFRIDVVWLFLLKSRIRLRDFFPFSHVMMASGREPDVIQWISYFRSATSVNELLSMLTWIGFTASLLFFLIESEVDVVCSREDKMGACRFGRCWEGEKETQNVQDDDVNVIRWAGIHATQKRAISILSFGHCRNRQKNIRNAYGTCLALNAFLEALRLSCSLHDRWTRNIDLVSVAKAKEDDFR